MIPLILPVFLIVALAVVWGVLYVIGSVDDEGACHRGGVRRLPKVIARGQHRAPRGWLS